MNELWYWKLGFSSNPFGIKPASLTSEVVGRHLDGIIEKIGNGSVQFIEAPLGSGKTTILKGIISKFGGRKKLIYCSCIKDESLRISELLRNATLKGRLFGSIPTGAILLVDEAQNVSKEDSQDITSFMASGNIKAAAFFGIHYNKSLLTDELNNSLNGNVTFLSTLSPEEAVQLVRHRIGNLKLMPDYVIREIYSRSSCNPRRLLQNCEDVCRKAVELSIKELTVTDVATLLKSREFTSVKKKRQGKAAGAVEEKPEKAKKAKKDPEQKAPAKLVRKAASKSAAKGSSRDETKASSAVSSTAQQTATVTYSGYNLRNIRTYEQEMGTPREAPEQDVNRPEED